jgi:uncharacterized protein (TIGR03083 family)
MMESQRFLDQLALSSQRLADAADAAGAAAAVPTCPGWTVTDLLVHMVRGDNWARSIVERGAQGITDRVANDTPDDLPAGDALVSYFRTNAEDLVATLARVDPTTPAWTFSSADRTATFWRRRRAHETAVHRVDAESAAGEVTPIDTDLAADGIDEFLVSFLPRLQEPLAAVGDFTFHVHCTDTEGEWLLSQRDGAAIVTAEHAKGDVAVRGTGSDLLLFLWGRVPAGSLEVFGDEALLGRISDAIRV